jgi:Na+-driven multidrug efflux pump
VLGEPLTEVVVNVQPAAARPVRTLDNLKHCKKPKKTVKGLYSQMIAAAACIGGWSDGAFFGYLADLPGGEKWLTEIPASTSIFRLFFRNCLTGGSSCGMILAEAVGQNDGERAQHVIIAGYTVSNVLILISSAGFALTHTFLRHLFTEELADASNAYFDWGQLGNAPAVWITTPMTQIALMCGALKRALVANLLFRLSIPALSYLFVVQMGMNATGVDLANGLAPWIGFLFLAACMHWGKVFADLRQWSWREFAEANRKEFKTQFWKGLLMMTQRATEYLNLALLGGLLGHFSRTNLVKINPFLQLSPFCTLMALGQGMIANMDTREVRAELLKALVCAERAEEGALELCEKLNRKLYVITMRTLVTGTVVNLVLMLLLIFLKEQLARLFVAASTAPDVLADASAVLMVTAFGIVPDAWRFLASNLLNTYDKIVTPNAISLFFMTLLGIGPLWIYTVVTKEDVFMPMFWNRNAMIVVSDLFILKILYNCMRADTQRIVALRARVLTAEPAVLLLAQEEAREAVPAPLELETVGEQAAGPRRRESVGVASYLSNLWHKKPTQQTANGEAATLVSHTTDRQEYGLN